MKNTYSKVRNPTFGVLKLGKNIKTLFFVENPEKIAVITKLSM